MVIIGVECYVKKIPGTVGSKQEGITGVTHAFRVWPVMVWMVWFIGLKNVGNLSTLHRF